MSRRTLATALIALAALVGLLATASPAMAKKAPRSFYGVTPQTEMTAADYRAMGRGKVGTLRFELAWGDLDPPPQSEEEFWFVRRNYRWWEIDPIVARAARFGIRVLPTVYGTPNWVARFQGCSSQCHKVGPSTVVAYVAFQQFMYAAAKRYGPDGDFWLDNPRIPYRPIRTWQIWNEQNSSDYWKPWPNITDYANLVSAGGEAIHRVDRGAQVILGGMIGEPAQEGKKTVSGWEFLQGLYENSRTRAAFDGIAVHPYGAEMRSVKRTVWHWRQELRAAGALGDEIWVTEIGWASGGGAHPLNRGLDGQARAIGQALDYFTKKRKQLNIANVDIYAWRDAAPGADQCQWCAKSGMVRYHRRQPKPAWDVFTSFTGGR